MTTAPESTASSTALAAPGITDYQTPAQQVIGDFAPKLVALTDDVLFGDAISLTRELFDGGEAR